MDGLKHVSSLGKLYWKLIFKNVPYDDLLLISDLTSAQNCVMRTFGSHLGGLPAPIAALRVAA